MLVTRQNVQIGGVGTRGKRRTETLKMSFFYACGEGKAEQEASRHAGGRATFYVCVCACVYMCVRVCTASVCIIVRVDGADGVI